MHANFPSSTSKETLKTTTTTATGDGRDTNKKELTNHDKEYHHSDTSKKTTTKKKNQASKKTHNNNKKIHNSASRNDPDNKSQNNSTTTTITTAALLPSSLIAKPTWIPYPTSTHENGAIAAFDNSSLSSSLSIPAAPVAEAEHTDSTLNHQSDEEYNTNYKSKDALMGSMLGVLGGITVLLITIIIFASHRRRKEKKKAINTGRPRERRGWGVRHSWYSTSDSSDTSQCPSTLPPPYNEKKRESLLKSPSPTIMKCTQYTSQLAYNPNFSADSSHLIQEFVTNQQEPLSPPPPPPRAASFAMTTTSNNGNSHSDYNSNNTGGNAISTTTPSSTSIPSPPNFQNQHRHQQHEQLPLPSGPAPRPSRYLVRTYQAQLDNNKIGSLPNDPDYPQ